MELVSGLVGDEDPWRVSEVYLFWTDCADHWEDVASTIDARIKALSCHVSQVGTDVEKLDERIRERARATGKEHGLEYAEDFKRIKL